jgi:hypothetical protein
VDPDDVSDILFTSGTTGRSKGAMSSHRQAIGVAEEWARSLPRRQPVLPQFRLQSGHPGGTAARRDDPAAAEVRRRGNTAAHRNRAGDRASRRADDLPGDAGLPRPPRTRPVQSPARGDWSRHRAGRARGAHAGRVELRRGLDRLRPHRSGGGHHVPPRRQRDDRGAHFWAGDGRVRDQARRPR